MLSPLLQCDLFAGDDVHHRGSFSESRFHFRPVLRRYLVVLAVAVQELSGLGISLDMIIRALASMPCVPGRFEHVDAGQPFQVIVDYAHTDDGLRNVLRAARGISSGRLMVVFGCGGDRDRTKRPKMGAVVAELSDYAIITSDNPRTERPEQILLDIEVGIRQKGWRKDDHYLVMLDRAEAIRRAIHMAGPGDLVLIAGKGHEDYQIVGSQRLPFDDRLVARAVLEARFG